MRDFLATIRILHSEVKCRLVNGFDIHAPALGGIRKGFLKFHKISKVGIVERVGFAKVSSRIKLVEPDFTRLAPFLEEKHRGFYASALERTTGAIKYGVEVAGFQQQLAQRNRGVVRVRQERVFNNHAATPSSSQHL